jgi:hypothetical protein
MADPATGATTSTGSSASQSWLSQMPSYGQEGLSGLALLQGLESGTGAGKVQAATSAAKLGSNIAGAGSTAGQVAGSLATDVANLSGIIRGLQAGGVMGYGSAGINTAALAGNVMQQGAKLGEFSSATGAAGKAIGNVAMPLASALATYNFASNWSSGSTGADAIRGAEMGATWGAEFGGPVGALVGTAAGAAFGAASSIFGPGREDPENVGWNQYAAAFDKGGAAGVAGATPSQNFQMLTGIFDSRGSQIPFYNKYGRGGENAFTGDMFKQVNAALAAGKLAPNATPDQIYSQVVQPWISSMSPGGWKDTATIQGNSEKAAVGNVLTQMIGQWQQGQITSGTQLGIAGQTLQGGVPAFGAQGYNQQQYQQQQQTQQSFAQQVSQLVASFPMGVRGVQARM